jgi:hypothetical protein
VNSLIPAHEKLLINFYKEDFRTMKQVKYLALLATVALLSPLGAFARDKNQRSVEIPEAVQVAGTRLQAGDYKVEWQGAGPQVQVSFLRNGKTVATVPGTLKTNDGQVGQDEILTDTSDANTKALKEIDFGRGKEALIFEQSGM